MHPAFDDEKPPAPPASDASAVRAPPAAEHKDFSRRTCQTGITAFIHVHQIHGPLRTGGLHGSDALRCRTATLEYGSRKSISLTSCSNFGAGTRIRTGDLPLTR